MLKWLLNKILPKKPAEIKPLFKNESVRLENEYRVLKTKNPGLYDLLQDLVLWSSRELQHNLTFTMIYRTQEEQDELYKNDARYKVKKFTSPHQLFHSADIRSNDMTFEQIKKVEDYLNGKYNAGNYYSWTARNHKIPGQAFHFHLQFVSK